MGEVLKEDKGIIEYGAAWEYQKEIFDAVIKDNHPNTFILCEHPHVYTLGKSGDINNILVNSTFLSNIGASFFKTDRGGDITYHGYGQIVGYPIINLEHYSLSLKDYIELVEQCVITVLKEYGIDGYRLKGATGVWVNNNGRENKICAIGVKASRYVTMHGFALNVNTDLKYFDYINPCGFIDKGVTSMKQLLSIEVDIDNVKLLLYDVFIRLLKTDNK